MNVVKNDLVLVIAGNDKGKQGKILKTFPKSDKVLVEGIRMIKRHTRPNPNNQQGGIVEKEAPINISNVMVICPKCSKPSRIQKKILETNKSVRICRSCEEMITTVV